MKEIKTPPTGKVRRSETIMGGELKTKQFILIYFSKLELIDLII